MKSVNEIERLGFIAIGKSLITLWHRPSVRDLTLLKSIHNVDLIVTLLSDSEDPTLIKKACELHGILNFRINLKGAN